MTQHTGFPLLKNLVILDWRDGLVAKNIGYLFRKVVLALWVSTPLEAD